MTPRSDMTLQTIADCSAFLAEMEATEDNRLYMRNVYVLLENSDPGFRIEIDKFVMSANLRKFIGCVCLYILDTDKAEFDNEYKYVKKL